MAPERSEQMRREKENKKKHAIWEERQGKVEINGQCTMTIQVFKVLL